jgi:hypothetical protein
VLKIRGRRSRLRRKASPSASAQKSLSRLTASRQLNTYRLNQSITATRYNPGVY